MWLHFPNTFSDLRGRRSWFGLISGGGRLWDLFIFRKWEGIGLGPEVDFVQPPKHMQVGQQPRNGLIFFSFLFSSRICSRVPGRQGFGSGKGRRGVFHCRDWEKGEHVLPSGADAERGERAGSWDRSWQPQSWGAQPSVLGVSFVGRPWERREARMGLQEAHAGESPSWHR